jgi:hypothetical protein
MLLLSSGLSADIKVTKPTKPWHVTEITASKPVCDSPTTYSFFVSWKPVFITWNAKILPRIWDHYVVGTKSECDLSLIMCGDGCIVKASGCSIKYPLSLMRIQTYLDEDEKGKGSFMQIGGIPRPPLTFDGKAWQCIN